MYLSVQIQLCSMCGKRDLKVSPAGSRTDRRKVRRTLKELPFPTRPCVKSLQVWFSYSPIVPHPSAAQHLILRHISILSDCHTNSLIVLISHLSPGIPLSFSPPSKPLLICGASVPATQKSCLCHVQGLIVLQGRLILTHSLFIPFQFLSRPF